MKGEDRNIIIKSFDKQQKFIYNNKMLKIKNVSASIDSEAVLHNIDLEILPGEIHSIIGPRRSGKSTLAHLIQGNPYVKVDEGSVSYMGKSIKSVPAHNRSKLGIFTTFQFPPEIDGLTNLQLMKALFEVRTKKEFTHEIESMYRLLVLEVGLDTRFPDDYVNSGSSHSLNDYKKSEIVQLLMLQPDLIVLDELDLDLNLEEIQKISAIIKKYIKDKNKGLIIISNCKSLLNELEPDYVHVLVNGQIRDVGSKELLKRIESDGNSQLP